MGEAGDLAGLVKADASPSKTITPKHCPPPGVQVARSKATLVCYICCVLGADTSSMDQDRLLAAVLLASKDAAEISRLSWSVSTRMGNVSLGWYEA